MRFHAYDDWSLSNDELSALNRVQFDNFQDLIDHGVRVEGHPAGYQTFVWFWTGWFGNDVSTFRIPFILAGIASLILAFLIASRWFNKGTALIAISFMAGLEFYILYSQLARPYSLALAFSLAMVYFWTRYLFDAKPHWGHLIGYVLFASLSTYFHYFSFMLAGIVGVTGLFYTNKKTRLPFIIAGAAIALLFVPHLGVFMDQFGQKGIGEWLPPPSNFFFFEHLYYIFNSSLIIAAVAGIFGIGGLLLDKSAFNKFHGLSLLFFGLPFLIGFCYSILVAPVVQHSTLLFSSVYCLFFLAALIYRTLPRWSPPMAFLLLLLVAFDTSEEKRFYDKEHFGVFEELATKLMEWEDVLAKAQLTEVININNPYYFQYYFDKQGRPLDVEMDQLSHGAEIGELQQVVQSSITTYFTYGWSSRYNPFEAEEIIRKHYPEVVERHVHFNSDITLYKKGKRYEKDVLFHSVQDLEETGNFWKQGTAPLDTNEMWTGDFAQKMGAGIEFSTTFEAKVGDLTDKTSRTLINFKTKAQLTEGAKAVMVMTFIRDGETISWHGAEIGDFSAFGSWRSPLLTRPFPKDVQPNDIIKCYVWNTGKSDLWIDHLEVEVHRPQVFNYQWD